MILPNKYLQVHESLLGAAALLLSEIRARDTVSSLWMRTRDAGSIVTFDRFVLALDILYALEVVDLQDNQLVKVSK